MTHLTTAQEIARMLAERSERVVFAESCTAGMVAATLGQIAGISKYLCGSVVSYQPTTKRKWLAVNKKTINKHTTESQHVANEMALNVLAFTPNANWSVSVVGHFGPDAPKEKDGQIFICVARRTKKKLKVSDTTEYVCKSEGRAKRQEEATEAVLTTLARVLHKRIQKDTRNGETPPKKTAEDKNRKKEVLC